MPGTADTAAMVTIHPSAILRMDEADRDAGFTGLVRDLTIARKYVADRS
jgi:hypothetical protein